MPLNPSPSLLLTPARTAAPQSGALDVLVRVQAPDLPLGSTPVPRVPLRLALVIDRSGSMHGEPLREALRCVEYIADHLQSTDQMGVVLYDDQVEIACPLRPGGNGQAVRAALEGVSSRGMTALFDGWEAGARMLEGGVDACTSRVLLLSDGQANEGPSSLEEIEPHCRKWNAAGVSTTTVGLGHGFNESLMIGMAQAGGGQHYYGQTAKDLHDSFDEELSLLSALYLRKLRVKLIPAQGVIAEPLGLVQQMDDGRIGLQDLAWGAEAWLLVRLHISKASDLDPRVPEALLAVEALAEESGGSTPVLVNGMLSLPLVGASDYHGLTVDPLVARRLKEIEFAQAAADVARAVASGNVSGAKALLAQLNAQVADHPWLSDKVKRLQELLQRDVRMAGKEMAYAGTKMSRRLTSKVEADYLASETESTVLPAFLRRKPSEGEGRRRKI